MSAMLTQPRAIVAGDHIEAPRPPTLPGAVHDQYAAGLNARLVMLTLAGGWYPFHQGPMPGEDVGSGSRRGQDIF